MSTLSNEGESREEPEQEEETETPSPSAEPSAEPLLIQSAREGQLRRKRQERLVLAGAFLFAGFIAAGAWFTEGRLFMVPWNAIMKYEAAGRASRDPGINCSLARNKNTPYCQNRRAEVEAQWEGIVRSGNGEQPFTLHGR